MNHQDGSSPFDPPVDALPRVNILGVGVTPVNLPQTIAILEQWCTDRRREYVCFPTVHSLVEAQRDPQVRSALNQARLTALDGMPLVWWCRRSGFPLAGRSCGPDLLPAMCERAAQTGHRHYFYGGRAETTAQLVARLRERCPGLVVAGYHSPPFRPLSPEEDAADVAAINAARPDFVWVGLGAPKQEKWMAEHLGKIDAAALLGVGAAFDFLAGELPRAPVWMQRRGLEWLFRLIAEPRRLARRYILYNSIFLGLAIQQIAGWKTYARDW